MSEDNAKGFFRSLEYWILVTDNPIHGYLNIGNPSKFTSMISYSFERELPDVSDEVGQQ